MSGDNGGNTGHRVVGSIKTVNTVDSENTVLRVDDRIPLLNCEVDQGGLDPLKRFVCEFLNIIKDLVLILLIELQEVEPLIADVFLAVDEPLAVR